MADVTERKKGVGLLTKCVLASDIFKHIRAYCKSRGIDLDIARSGSGYYRNFASYENVITWGVHWRHERFRTKTKRVMFCENGMLCQSSGMYTNNMGFFANSSIPILKEYNDDVVPDEIERLFSHVFKCWGVQIPDKPVKRAGKPILVALQMPQDSTMQFYFPLTMVGRCPVSRFLEMCYKHLPKDVPVIVRPHPKDKDRFLGHFQRMYSMYWRPEWEVDTEGSVYDLLPEVSAVVAVNSTAATEALCWGLPVAVCGRHIFTGTTDVMLDCSEDPARMNGILDFYPDMERAIRYLCAILRHQMPYDASYEMVECNKDLNHWINRVLESPSLL